MGAFNVTRKIPWNVYFRKDHQIKDNHSRQQLDRDKKSTNVSGFKSVLGMFMHTLDLSISVQGCVDL